MEKTNEFFDVLWSVPETNIEMHTECKSVDDLMIYVRAYIDHKIRIISINGMEIIPSSNVEVVK